MIAERIHALTSQLPQGVRLVAISKFHPAEAIAEAYAAGQRLFGESRVQELQAKHEALPKDIEWHFIGHLQTNKVKYIVPYVSLIHGIDSFRLLAEVDRQAERVGRTVGCLLQMHIAREETKFGFSFEECRQLLQEGEWRQLHHVRLCGMMGMATNTDNMQQVEEEFRSLATFFHEVKTTWFAADEAFCELSMGMSHDYLQAIAAGSTLIRVGTYIFGERNY
ncbi:MAG: YggS family pyridoxal phosphate-dependent enzyme [Mediterranea sp.]|nr:YggS family pyridoxal phosphate-dependent enzyme [Mediterranea sp.]